MSTLVALKMFRELPFLFPRTFTFNELIILCSMCSARLFNFVLNIFQVSNHLDLTRSNKLLKLHRSNQFSKGPVQSVEELFVVEVIFP